MTHKKALVVGGLGVIGRNLVEYLQTLEDWEIIGLSRRKPDFSSRAKFISVDLLDRKDCQEKLSGLTDITHIFYAAFQPSINMTEMVAPNLAMLQYVVETIEPISPHLKRIVLMQGVKAYGVHLGSFKTPAKETDPRHMPPNFYYDQEDFLKARQNGKSWTWAVLRPDAVCGFGIGNPMNLSMVIAVYAAISKELGLPLRFPGKLGAYTALAQVTDSTHLAKATVWAATESNTANEIFNITNGDYFRWQHLFPKFAEFFDMEYGLPQTISLVEQMADKEPVWNAITAKYKLKPYRYQSLAAWEFGDFIFGCEYDVMSSTTKIHEFGFHEVIDSEAMFLNLFRQFQHAQVIP